MDLIQLFRANETKLEAKTKSVKYFFALCLSFFSCRSRCLVEKQEAWQNRGWSAYCTGRASRLLNFSSLLDLSSSDREDRQAQYTHLCMKLMLMPILITELSVRFSRAPHWQAALLCYQVVEENSLALPDHFTALATPTHIQAIGNASGTFTQRLVAAFNWPFRNLTLNITQTATMMFWR